MGRQQIADDEEESGADGERRASFTCPAEARREHQPEAAERGDSDQTESGADEDVNTNCLEVISHRACLGERRRRVTHPAHTHDGEDGRKTPDGRERVAGQGVGRSPGSGGDGRRHQVPPNNTYS